MTTQYLLGSPTRVQTQIQTVNRPLHWVTGVGASVAVCARLDAACTAPAVRRFDPANQMPQTPKFHTKNFASRKCMKQHHLCVGPSPIIAHCCRRACRSSSTSNSTRSRSEGATACAAICHIPPIGRYFHPPEFFRCIIDNMASPLSSGPVEVI